MNFETQLQINIPHYPPFKLRSSLIDKDPVIWVHLLETYIRLFMFLDNNEAYGYNLIHVKSQQQLQLFLKVYLAETVQEHNKIFSLGHINPEIRSNGELLRARVFSFIKNSSIIKLNFTGEAVWQFISIYITDNSTTVRQLVDGTFKSKFNEKKSGGISSIPVLYKHLKESIINGKFTTSDLDTLSKLLGQHIASKAQHFNLTGGPQSVNGLNKTIRKANTSSLPFAEQFVKAEWIEILEELYLSIHKETAKNVMITSLISLSVAKIAKLAMDLHVTSSKTLGISPLFSSLIISEPFQELIPGLEERLQFLRNILFDEGESNDLTIPDIEISDEHVQFLAELFPNLNEGKAISILKKYNGDLDQVTNLILENPDIIDTIDEYNPEIEALVPISKLQLNRFATSSQSMQRLTKDLGTKRTAELNSKTLASALELLYDSDEDEPDDSYSWEAAAAENAAIMGEAEGEGDKTNSQRNTHNIILPVEKFLFASYKEEGISLFLRNARNSATRQRLKSKSGWSDEQIEGWFRMLEKVPKRLKLLERDFLENGNPNKKIRNPPIEKMNDERGEGEKEDKGKPNKNPQRERKQANKNKASQGNHNRKARLAKKMS